jgi:serine/threonine-protein kinase
MPNISIRKKEKWGFEGYSTINHDYNLKTIGYVAIGDTIEVHVEVVVDNATGLMWMRAGNGNYLEWDEAQKWVTKLNQLGYAGYQDWRLPTLEEAASLLESNKRDALYIDPVFSRRQDGCWTGDKKSEFSVWHVDFEVGSISFVPGSALFGISSFARPVRSVE